MKTQHERAILPWWRLLQNSALLLNGIPMYSLLKAGVAVLACVFLVLGCGTGSSQSGAKSVDDIVREFRAAMRSPAADEAACNALSVYTSDAADPLSELVRQYAQQGNVDQSDADRLVAAANGIEASQVASDVLSELNCPP